MKTNLLTRTRRVHVAAIGFYSTRQAILVVTGALLLALMLALPALAQDKNAKEKGQDKKASAKIELRSPADRNNDGAGSADTFIVLRKKADGTMDTLLSDIRKGGKDRRIYRYRFGDDDARLEYLPDAPHARLEYLPDVPHAHIWGDINGEAFVFDGDSVYNKRFKAFGDSLRKLGHDEWVFGFRKDGKGTDPNKNLRKRLRIYGEMPGFSRIPFNDFYDFMPPRAPMPARPPVFGFRDDARTFGEMKSSLGFEQFAFSPEGETGYRLKLRTDNLKDPIRIQLYNRNRESVFTDTGRGGTYDGKIDVSAFGPGLYLLEVTQGDKSFTRTIPIR
jgi:hypothetical protein